MDADETVLAFIDAWNALDEARIDGLTERVDRFVRGDDHIVVPVMGAFEVSGGRIAKWRDYFDLRALKPQVRS